MPYDGKTARHYAEIVTARRALRQPIGAFYALIAATERVAGAAIATGDIGGLLECGIDLIDPWAEQAGTPCSQP